MNLIDAVKNSSPPVKLSIAIASGVAIGIISTVAIQAYGAKKERTHSLPIRLVQYPMR